MLHDLFGVCTNKDNYISTNRANLTANSVGVLFYTTCKYKAVPKLNIQVFISFNKLSLLKRILTVKTSTQAQDYPNFHQDEGSMDS
jgi:hypothetical protein